MKQCRVCGDVKPLSEYYAKPSCRDGHDTQCKVCYKAKRNAQAAENRKDPEYVAKRNEQSRLCKAQRYQDPEYREKEKERSRDWHRDKYAIDEVYREAERARNREKCNTAYAEDPEYRMKQIARQHARRHETKGSYTPDQWLESVAYFEHQCAYCGETDNLTVEHIIAISRGGTNYAYNVIPACSKCNGSKGAKDIIEWYTSQVFYKEKRLLNIHKWYSTKQTELLQSMRIKGGGPHDVPEHR